jgi:molybdate transport system substrate-binding protein
MQKESVYERAKDKFVLGENIAQTASFVSSGSADIGILALSLAMSPNLKDKGRYGEIPADEYPPIEQACVILKSSKSKELAGRFLEYVKSDAVAGLLVKYGFDVSDRGKLKRFD